MKLLYPHDRVNGFVQLSDGNGIPYVTDFIQTYDIGCDAGNAMKYAGAFLILSRRADEANAG